MGSRYEFLQALSDADFLAEMNTEENDNHCFCANCQRYRRLTKAELDRPVTGHPNRLPESSEARKEIPIGTGLIDYFPNALAAIAFISKRGNDKHNPGEPLHWSRDKSNDHYDCAVRHLIDRGGCDSEGNRHTAMAAWRILALLEIEMEEALGLPPSRGST